MPPGTHRQRHEGGLRGGGVRGKEGVDIEILCVTRNCGRMLGGIEGRVESRQGHTANTLKVRPGNATGWVLVGRGGGGGGG